MALTTCRLSCVDLGGIEHAVELSANSLYGAVAQALRIFRDNDWIEGIGRGQTAILEELDSLDKGPTLAATSCLGCVYTEGDSGDTRRPLLAKVALKCSIEVELGDDLLTRIRLAQANKTATCVKITSLVWKVDLFILAKEEANEVGTVRD